MSDMESSDTEHELGPQCPAWWPDGHIDHLDGRQCRFILKKRDGGWVCPAHGPQTVPETATDNEDGDRRETEQSKLVTDGGTVEDGMERSPEAISARAERLRRDEFERVEVADADYTCWRWKVGGKEPDGKPTRIGKWTFATKMVRDIVLDHIDGRVLNACAGETKLRKRGCEFIRNDIDEDIDADLHVDVRDLHEHFAEESFDSVVLDPPFDPGRAAKLYEGWHGQEYSHARDAVGQLVKPGGSVVELGWNSYGLHDVDDDERPSWERQAWYVYPQASFKGDVHLKVDQKVPQATLISDGSGWNTAPINTDTEQQGGQDGL